MQQPDKIAQPALVAQGLYIQHLKKPSKKKNYARFPLAPLNKKRGDIPFLSTTLCVWLWCHERSAELLTVFYFTELVVVGESGEFRAYKPYT